MNKSVLGTDIFKQKRTTEKLVEESQADLDFYVFLCASVFITTLGLAIDNPIVIVGAMLVAPMLYPILALGLGIVTKSGHAMLRALRIIGQSAVTAIIIAFVTSYVIDISSSTATTQLDLLLDPDLFLFFLVSLAAGVVASFSWVMQKTALSFPGVAITVSLVPPISAVGIAAAVWSKQLLVGSALLFAVNLAGIVLASIIVFALFGFQRVRVWQDERIRKQEEAITKEPNHNGDAITEDPEDGSRDIED